MAETPGDWLHTSRNKRVRLLKAMYNYNMYNYIETAKCSLTTDLNPLPGARNYQFKIR
jgi:hypothetical protein